MSPLFAPAAAAASASASYCPRGGGDAVTASGCDCGGEVAAGGPEGAPCKLEFGGSVAEGEIVPAAEAPIDGLGNTRMISRFGCRIRGVGVPACRPAEKLKLTQRLLLISVWNLEIVVAGVLLVQMPTKTAMQEGKTPKPQKLKKGWKKSSAARFQKQH
uniref:Uncharacterized protein n=1 Tax=Oryza punctata TaxID=4537 RepID=A0A0E0M925_ORYPU